MSMLPTGFNSFMITPPPHSGITSKPLQILQTKVQGVCHPKTLLINHNGFKALTSLEDLQAGWLKEKSYKDTVDPDSTEVKSTKVNTCVVKESDVIVERLLRFSSWHKAKVAVALCLKVQEEAQRKGHF